MMTNQEVFDLGVKMGVDADPRGIKGVQKYLKKIQKYYDDLKPSEKKYYDTSKLTNPFPDSGVHVDDGKTKVKRVMAGIDIGPSDILLASQLAERGKKIDLVIAHHPIGKAMASLHEVMEMSVEMYEAMGVPVHLIEKISEDRARDVGHFFHAMNQYQAINMAEILGVNLINTHTITDNLVDNFLRRYFEKTKPETVGDLMESLLEIEEYSIAKKMGFGPMLCAGSPSYRVGKYILEMTGGTEPSPKLYQHLSHSGISTVVGMHMKAEHLQKVSEVQMNVVIAGHISSDSLGMNLYLDELEKKGIEVVPCSGLIRVSRVKKNKK